MPRNGNGNYSPPPSSWNPAVNGSAATAADWDALRDDIAAALSASVAKDGQTEMSGALKMGGQRITGLGAPTANTDALRRSQITKGADIASAATIQIPVEGLLFDVTGTTQINEINPTFPGRTVLLRFAAEVTLRHSSTLICPAERNYTAKAGTIAVLTQVSSSAWQVFSGAGSGYSFEIGDYLDTARNLTSDPEWLRRNGATYPKAAYPDLAPLMPPAPVGTTWTPKGLAGLPAQGTRFSQPIWVPGENQYVLFAFKVADSAGQNLFRYTSPTGEAWTEDADTGLSRVSNGSVSIAFDGDSTLICLFPGESGANLIHISADAGASWTAPTTAPSSPEIIRGATWDPLGQKFFLNTVRGDLSNARLWSSDDGDVWSLVGTYSNIVGGALTINGLYSAGGLIFWVDGFLNLFISFDNGASFTAPVLPGGGSAAWLPIHLGDKFVVSVAGSVNKLYKTTDWLSFTEVFGVGAYGFSTFGNGIVTAYEGTPAVSLDNGETWETVTPAQINQRYFLIGDPTVPTGRFYLGGRNNLTAGIELGVRSLPNYFIVPNDNPTNGWIKAL